MFDFTNPEFPYPPGSPHGPVMRFRCPDPAGCAWFHDERTDTEPAEPLRIPLGSDAEISAALTAHADARLRGFWERVTAACSAHVVEAHPDAAYTVPQRPAAPRPVPMFPYPRGHELEKVARFACPSGCSWTVDVSTDLGPPRMQVASPDRIAGVQSRLQARATALVEAFWSVVTGAISAHVTAEHPGGG
ncbi:hypothetical protein [Streptomyces sp. G1]|uniref:hypothetical protein n=1 Tax=Streptomyces sp. G1 TaxID=361572 RepID=UPI00202F9CA5|nr:hypothetical protein [Streptomyces sp. G1]MCM1964820.1 hypothetical protein [Streptomyces sp. G1]